MRIGINAQLCSPSSSYRNAGVSRYVRNLVHSIGAMEHAAETHLFLPGSNRDPFPASCKLHHRAWQPENPLARIAWEQFVLPGLIRRLNLDVFHSPMHVLPVVCPTRSVVTIHDLTFMLYPETFPSLQRRYLEFCTRRAVEKADAVIAVSECTRQDIIRLLDGEPERVFTTVEAADDSFVPASSEKIEEIRHRYAMGDLSVLYVGTLEPRKNIPTLLSAFDRVRKAIGSDCGLVLAGGKGWLYDEVFRRIEALGLEDSVRLIGYVPKEDLPALYSGATAFVYPSLYEGFGLPPLEAMACGTPVITSNASSLPEVVGDAGIMVDPHSVEELADAILKVLCDADIRQQMISRGLERAKGFSWQETARRTLKVYEDAWQGKGIAGREGSNSPRFPESDGRR